MAAPSAGAAGAANNYDLDKILQDVLQDFEEDKKVEASVAGAARRAAASVGADAAGAAAAGGAPAAGGAALPFMDDTAVQGALEKMITDMKDPEFQHILDQTLKQLSVADGLASDGIAPPKREADSKFGFSVAHPTPGETKKVGASSANVAAAAASSLFSTLAVGSGPEATDSLAKTLEVLQRLASEDSAVRTDGKGPRAPGAPAGQSAASVEQLSDETIARMMEEFEGMGAKEDFNFAVEGMMKQLLAKDIMYLPMKQICQKFPAWLAQNKAALSMEQYEHHGKQFRCFQRLVATYETEPDNFNRLMALMQDLQEFGNPPADIVRELAPGLDLSNEGMPILPNMGPGLPQLPTMPGTPCCVM